MPFFANILYTLFTNHVKLPMLLDPWKPKNNFEMIPFLMLFIIQWTIALIYTNNNSSTYNMCIYIDKLLNQYGHVNLQLFKIHIISAH